MDDGIDPLGYSDDFVFWAEVWDLFFPVE